jgi:hypothetical protein
MVTPNEFQTQHPGDKQKHPFSQHMCSPFDSLRIELGIFANFLFTDCKLVEFPEAIIP